MFGMGIACVDNQLNFFPHLWIVPIVVGTQDFEAKNFNALFDFWFRLEKQEHCITWEMCITLKGKM